MVQIKSYETKMSPGKIVLGTKYLNPQYAMLFLVTFIDLNIYKASI